MASWAATVEAQHGDRRLARRRCWKLDVVIIGGTKRGDDTSLGCDGGWRTTIVADRLALENLGRQKITISLPVNSDKCRAKAMQIAVSTTGVISVNSDADKNQLVVTGNGVDSFELMKCLKRKFRCASIVSIEEVKPPEKKDDKKEEKKKDEKKEEEKDKKDEWYTQRIKVEKGQR
nr:heavy metal-associated isoprenylated plant protein 16-like isoform X1 [Ipomoea trifida]